MAVITQNELKTVLDYLGTLTEDEIAKRVKHIIGKEKAECGHPERCAIAVYLHKALAVPQPWQVSVGTYSAEVFNTQTVESVFAPLPRTVTRFIQAFDNGDYPDLATEDSLKQVLKDKAAAEV